jgi:AcrR family transcriptional regulator
MPQQERSEHTFNLVLDSAAAEFERVGFAGARMDDIVERTGLTKGAVYFHFKSKQALAEELVADKYQQWSPVIDSVNAEGARGLDAIRLLSVRVAAVFRDNVRVRAAMTLSQELFPANPDVNAYTGWATLVTSYLQQAESDGNLRPNLDIPVIARTAVRAFFGVYMIANELGDLDHLVPQVNELWDVLFAGLTRTSTTQSADERNPSR